MSMVFLGMTHCKKCWAKLDGEIGLCESCRQAEERESKSSEQVSKSEGKYKLIDILNKIANGELKEGTRVIWGATEFIYKNFILESETGNSLYDYIGKEIGLLAEVELIEPQEPKECEHEWSKYSIGRLGRTENYRRCKKCGIHEEDIEPTDNTKIEELKGNEYSMIDIFYKLNEVIRYINK